MAAKEGTTLVASHVSPASGWGALGYLYTLTVGDLVWTKDASGRLREWQLRSMRVEEDTNFPQDYSLKTFTRLLVVVTCSGHISGGHHDKNVLAIANSVDPTPTK